MTRKKSTYSRTKGAAKPRKGLATRSPRRNLRLSVLAASKNDIAIAQVFKIDVFFVIVQPWMECRLLRHAAGKPNRMHYHPHTLCNIAHTPFKALVQFVT